MIVAYDRQHPASPRPLFTLGTPVGLTARLVFPRPVSHYGTGRNAGVVKPSAPHWHTGRPDLDNILKLVTDALHGRIFANDSQIAKIAEIEKLYADSGEAPCTELWFWEQRDRGVGHQFELVDHENSSS